MHIELIALGDVFPEISSVRISQDALIYNNNNII